MYPISYEADFNPTPNRWTTFFRLLLAIPWFIVATLLADPLRLHPPLRLGRGGDPRPLPAVAVRLQLRRRPLLVRISAWVYLQTDVWPPFGLSDDPSYPIRVNFAPAAERQSRLKAFFRIILAPADADRLLRGQLHAPLAAVVAWLTIVFRGYLPEGINNALTFVNSFHARVFGYSRSSPTTTRRSGSSGAPRRPGPPRRPHPPRRPPHPRMPAV